MDAQEKKRKVKQIIEENLFMVLSTTTIYTNTAEKWHGKWIDKKIEVNLFD